MSLDLELLLAVQAQDAERLRLEARLAELPRRLAAGEERVRRARAALEAGQQGLQQVALQRRAGEKEVEALSNQERQFQGKTMGVKTNEELRALQSEIAAVRARRSELETVVLEGMEEEDRRRGELAQLEAAVAEAESQAAAERRELDEERGRVGAERDQAARRRDDLIQGLPPELRARYERVLKSRGDRAVVRMAKNSCGGCHTAMPPQRASEVRRGDIVVTCEFCGRLVVGVEE